MVLVKAPKGKISHHVSSSLKKPKSITLNPELVAPSGLSVDTSDMYN
jgi:hypothetical protein